MIILQSRGNQQPKENPQVDATLERVHATVTNIIRTMDLNQDDDEINAWSDVLAATMLAVTSTYHTTLQATPAQLVSGQDSILNIQSDASWNHIHACKQCNDWKKQSDRRTLNKLHMNAKLLIRHHATMKEQETPSLATCLGRDLARFERTTMMMEL